MNQDMQNALNRAQAEKNAGASCVSIFSNVLIDGDKIGHISSDGFSQKRWKFHAADEHRRDREGSFDDVLPRWAASATLGPFRTCTETLSDEGATTEDQVKVKPIPLHERHGISREDCLSAIGQSNNNRRNVSSAADKIRRARDIVELLKAADESYDYDDELSQKTHDQLDRVLSLLKSAEKKIDKYGDQQMNRDIENWKQGGAK